MKHLLSVITLAVFVLALSACEKDGSQDPPAPSPAAKDAAATSPISPAGESSPDGGRRDITDGGYYPGRNTKPM